ncbi:hypothetical protein SAMN05892883_2097 [Jatrophihabitans sp. GAS493]|uniref:hypothetical protein n=1 Tax=Jatrophihabitans sp. GAS493 TaxID=1907575 RepID=UPI000BB8F1A5|nr:hypothetical protein [Jatrophihabitans sp. GAS493]SOD72751.1 hypothetical protein SAMN05892883_2097 [Jatrophihabitans sp. GAS493]
MPAVSVDDIQVEIVEKRTGTITLTAMPTGWEIVGVSAKYRQFGQGQVYRYTVKRCDCRDNPASEMRHPIIAKRSRHADSELKYRVAANTGSRTLCPKEPGHNNSCHNTLDHCKGHGHEEKVRALFEAVCKSYR